jgi:hypothetical protein
LKSQLTAFLSVSADPIDAKVGNWFSNLLRRFDVNPILATELPEPRPPPEKIRNFIQKSDMFVGVLTRREKVEGKNLWKAPNWVQDEISMAYTLKKPMAIFVEKDVQTDRSIGPFLVDYVSFDRKNLASVKARAEKYIEALRDRVGQPTYTQAEEDEINRTIVDDVEESILDNTIVKLGRTILLKRYGRLDVSLKNFYAVSAVLLFAMSYIIYDFIYGIKILGTIGAVVAMAIIVIILSTISLAASTRCRKCGSYFSERQKPVTYADIQKFGKLPENRRLLKFVCEVCRSIRYTTEEKKQASEE